MCPGEGEDIDINYERRADAHGPCGPRQNAQTTYLLNEYGVGDFVRTFHVAKVSTREDQAR